MRPPSSAMSTTRSLTPLTVTVCVHVEKLPQSSVAVQVMVMGEWTTS